MQQQKMYITFLPVHRRCNSARGVVRVLVSAVYCTLSCHYTLESIPERRRASAVRGVHACIRSRSSVPCAHESCAVCTA